MMSKVKQVAQEIGLKIKNAENMSKSKWKKAGERKNRKAN